MTTTATASTGTAADTAPVADFFTPGTSYVKGQDGYKAPEQTASFQCVHVAPHPRPGAGLYAFGFRRINHAADQWVSVALPESDFPDWTARSGATTATADATNPDTAADFLTPGTDYTDGPDGWKAPEETAVFRCVHVARHPRPGAGLRAFGFHRPNRLHAEWTPFAVTESDFSRWTALPTTSTAADAATAPATDTAVAPAADTTAAATGTPEPEPHPAPGTEYPFSISDLARATARLLGDGWDAESGPWGTSGTLSGPYITSFEFVVDYEGDLVILYDGYPDDGFPEVSDLPDDVHAYKDGLSLPLACAADGLEALAQLCAAAIRAVTGDHDTTSSASRQHHIDTGRYLAPGEAEQV
ncbi:hypothetical protein ACWGQ5_54145 [Streptomyces sp. NPDC055722]